MRGKAECRRGRRAQSRARPRGQPRDDGEQHERGQHEEDEGEEQPHRDAAGVRLGAAAGARRAPRPRAGRARARPARRAGRTRAARRRAAASAGAAPRRVVERVGEARHRARTPAAPTAQLSGDHRWRPPGRGLDREVRRAPGADRDAEQVERDRAARARAQRRRARRVDAGERRDDAWRPGRPGPAPAHGEPARRGPRRCADRPRHVAPRAATPTVRGARRRPDAHDGRTAPRSTPHATPSSHAWSTSRPPTARCAGSRARASTSRREPDHQAHAPDAGADERCRPTRDRPAPRTTR